MTPLNPSFWSGEGIPRPKKRLKALIGMALLMAFVAADISSRKGRPIVVPARELRRVRRFMIFEYEEFTQ
jgi:hypothetical protein